MEIISSPAFYSSAFGENNFRITANESEIIEFIIYDNNLNRVIGKKKLSGASLYNMDISNYAIRQFEVKPIEFSKTGFKTPGKRMSILRIENPVASRNVCLVAGLEKIKANMKLSKAPEAVNITPAGKFEITTLIDNIEWLAKITFNNSSRSVVLDMDGSTGSYALETFCLDMADLGRRLAEAGRGKISDFMSMTVTLYSDVIPDRKVEQKFNIVEESPDDIELCWWNHYGQIDYHTFRKLKTEIKADRKTITTDAGSKIINGESENHMSLASEYADEKTLEWFGDLLKSPAVWINDKSGYTPVQITTDRMTVGSMKLSRMEATIMWKDKINFRNL